MSFLTLTREGGRVGLGPERCRADRPGWFGQRLKRLRISRCLGPSDGAWELGRRGWVGKTRVKSVVREQSLLGHGRKPSEDGAPSSNFFLRIVL